MPSFFVEGTPAPQGSKTGFIRGGRVVLVESSKKVKPWREAVGAKAREVFDSPMSGPISIDIEFVLPRTKAMGDKVAPPMIQKPDGDKLVRAVFDAVTGIAIRDDSEVTSHSSRKRRAKPGEAIGAHITIQQSDWEEESGRI